MKKMKNKAKYWSVIWGVILIIAAVLLLLDELNVFSVTAYGFTLWKIFGVLVCLAWLVREIVKKKYYGIFIPLALIFLFSQTAIANLLGRGNVKLASEWIVLLSAVLLTIGFRTLFRKKRSAWKDIGSFSNYIDASELSNTIVKDLVGNIDVFITNKEKYAGNGEIEFCDIVGKVRLHAPSEWFIKTEVFDKIGRLIIPEQKKDSYEKTLTLKVYDFVGDIEVIFY